MTEAELAELEYLRFFFGEADFGPADEDVRYYIDIKYKKSGKKIPEGYSLEVEDDDS